MVKLIETDAQSIHGTNPPYLLKIIRTRICESKHWKEECFGLTTKLVVDKAMALSSARFRTCYTDSSSTSPVLPQSCHALPS
ncbi:hypothetical protein QTO34_006338 [Cnephaeus nilssonii]|uniref:Pre-mRNA-splicing factor 38B n=1 Tax=Cnephaeus nilssonii TaxID=3371016 RepID=A0AA40LHT5_CNENI|nr:hypothetical protein QTO34_006338 [Eptesicus nilssonii]